MRGVGIVCEYNPFHNGHVYQINKVREMFPDKPIVVVMSGNFTQRGDVAVLDKWTRTDIALNYVDLVVELPFVFSCASADIFAYGAISILKKLGVSHVVFGTESLCEDDLFEIARVQRLDEFDGLVKSYLNFGFNYPTSLSKAVFDLCNIKVSYPNDLLGVSYVKNLIDCDIVPVVIRRTNDFHCEVLDGEISSASSIRCALKSKIDIKKYVPLETYECTYELHFVDDYFELLKYKIISEIDCLDRYAGVDEGIENRIRMFIYDASDFNDLVSKVKTKRYTFNKLSRMFIYILCGFTKDENVKNLEYIRVLGFNDRGREYLKNVKSGCDVAIISGYSKEYEMLQTELRVNYVYYLNGVPDFVHKPIIK